MNYSFGHEVHAEQKFLQFIILIKDTISIIIRVLIILNAIIVIIFISIKNTVTIIILIFLIC